MTTAIIDIAKNMVRKAREVTDLVSNKTMCKICDTIEFLVLMLLPFALPFLIMYFSLAGY